MKIAATHSFKINSWPPNCYLTHFGRPIRDAELAAYLQVAQKQLCRKAPHHLVALLMKIRIIWEEQRYPGLYGKSIVVMGEFCSDTVYVLKFKRVHLSFFGFALFDRVSVRRVPTATLRSRNGEWGSDCCFFIEDSVL